MLAVAREDRASRRDGAVEISMTRRAVAAGRIGVVATRGRCWVAPPVRGLSTRAMPLPGPGAVDRNEFSWLSLSTHKTWPTPFGEPVASARLAESPSYQHPAPRSRRRHRRGLQPVARILHTARHVSTRVGPERVRAETPSSCGVVRSGATWCVQAGEGTRTLDIQLGRLTLYRLSYAREIVANGSTDPRRAARIRVFGRARGVFGFARDVVSTRAAAPVRAPPRSSCGGKSLGTAEGSAGSGRGNRGTPSEGHPPGSALRPDGEEDVAAPRSVQDVRAEPGGAEHPQPLVAGEEPAGVPVVLDAH